LLSSGNGLAMFSKRGRIGDIDGTLELVVDKTRFNIVYAVFKDEVQILAIVHQSKQRPISKDVEKTILELLQ